MSEITSNNLSGQSIGRNLSSAGDQAAGGLSADKGLNTENWFGSDAANGQLIDIDPPSHFHGMSTQALAQEILQHILE